MSEKGDGTSADTERPAGDEEVIGPLIDGYDSQGEEEVERAAALPSKGLAALNLDGVTMATLQAVGKRVGCTADFPKKSMQTAHSFLVDHQEAEEKVATAARKVEAGVYGQLLVVGDTLLLSADSSANEGIKTDQLASTVLAVAPSKRRALLVALLAAWPERTFRDFPEICPRFQEKNREIWGHFRKVRQISQNFQGAFRKARGCTYLYAF